MSSQFFVINATEHNVSLKLKRCHNRLTWPICHDKSHSLDLPVSANHVLKYKITNNGKTVAKVFIDHTGIVRSIKNLSKKFYVVANDLHFRQHCLRRLVMHGTGPTGIYILNKHH